MRQTIPARLAAERVPGAGPRDAARRGWTQVDAARFAPDLVLGGTKPLVPLESGLSGNSGGRRRRQSEEGQDGGLETLARGDVLIGAGGSWGSRYQAVPAAVTAPLVTIVILNWNGASDTVACLRSCAHLVDRPAPAIVVVDNASTDESVPEIHGEFPATPVIEAPSNLGYAGGNNLGIRWALEAGSEYIWLLNNDTRVAPRALAELVDALRADRGAAMAGSKILYDADPDRLWSPFRGRAAQGCSIHPSGGNPPYMTMAPCLAAPYFFFPLDSFSIRDASASVRCI